MRLPLFQLDAFADGPFSGNPAAVCLVDGWPDDSLMQNIAAENNLSETAFLWPREEDYALRWFTPTLEVNLCGHATLASAHVVFHTLDENAREARFSTRSGVLTVTRRDDRIEMNFPAWKPERGLSDNEPFFGMQEALGSPALEVFRAGEDLMAVYPDRKTIAKLEPDYAELVKVPCRGIIVTGPGDGKVDFVSRFFAPASGVNEDPVTGSAHCALTPFWSQRLGRKTLSARQLSARGGLIGCQLAGERVLLSGKAYPYLEGAITV